MFFFFFFFDRVSLCSPGGLEPTESHLPLLPGAGIKGMPGNGCSSLSFLYYDQLITHVIHALRCWFTQKCMSMKNNDPHFIRRVLETRTVEKSGIIPESVHTD